MHQLEFTRLYDYSSENDSVVVPAVLRAGDSQVQLAASVDTGASCSLFGSEIAEVLGLDLTSGIRAHFRTATGGFEA